MQDRLALLRIQFRQAHAKSLINRILTEKSPPQVAAGSQFEIKLSPWNSAEYQAGNTWQDSMEIDDKKQGNPGLEMKTAAG
jgi:hypothetical protein